MKLLFIGIITFILVLSGGIINNQLKAQNVGINQPNPDASALLDLTSTDHGLLIPRMTQVQRNAIDLTGNPLSVLIYQTDNIAGFYYYNGTAWVQLGGGGSGGEWEDAGIYKRVIGNDNVRAYEIGQNRGFYSYVNVVGGIGVYSGGQSTGVYGYGGTYGIEGDASPIGVFGNHVAWTLAGHSASNCGVQARFQWGSVANIPVNSCRALIATLEANGTIGTLSDNSTAIYGEAISNITGGNVFGIYGKSSSPTTGIGCGIGGIANGIATTNIGGYFSATNATNNYAGIFENGNVGIGTTSPSSKLDVVGNAEVYGNIGINLVPDADYSIKSDQASAPLYGAKIYGSDFGIMGCSKDYDVQGVLGCINGFGTICGVRARCWNVNGAGSVGHGLYAEAYNSEYSFAVFGNVATGTSSEYCYGVYGNVNDFSDNCTETYGLYGMATGGGTAYGVYGKAVSGSTNWAGYFDGDVYATGDITAGGSCCASDISWKKNISTIHNALDKVMQLRGVEFEWKTDEYPDKNFSKRKQIGLIAQELEAVIPELVKTGEDGKKYVFYENVVAVLIEAVKEQQETISSLTFQNEKLETEMNVLKLNNIQQKADIEQIKQQLQSQFGFQKIKANLPQSQVLFVHE
ncbi:MAG: tail fiber domain-containing protein [Bacteroidota bacterium]